MCEKIGVEKNKMAKYVKICERAEKLQLHPGERIDALMDIESADLVFDLRLDDWLKADDFNFMHDFYGIRDNIVRDEFPATDFGLFIPRFAGRATQKMGEAV